jgi:hypothetical protein
MRNVLMTLFLFVRTKMIAVTTYCRANVIENFCPDFALKNF